MLQARVKVKDGIAVNIPYFDNIECVYIKAALSFSYQDLVFAILVANNQLITLVRPKNYSLHPAGVFLNHNY